MISDTLTAGLEEYKIGPKIRALRQKKKLGLVQLGNHTGLSSAMLSKIERGQIFPTLPTLLRIAMVFGVGLDHFFTEPMEKPTVAVTRKRERLPMPDRPDIEKPSYFFESLDFLVTDRKLETFYVEFPADAPPSPPHRHPGAELIFIIKGELNVDVEGDTVHLADGDAMYFDSGAAHSYQRAGTSDCRAVVVVAPKD